MVRVENVTRVYEDGEARVRALDGVSLEVGDGDCVAVTGPSGCGKSTLLNILGGLDRPDGGSVMVGGMALHKARDEELTRYRRFHVGIVFQFYNLLPSMTVMENVCLPLLLRGERQREATERAREGLELAGMGHRVGHFPHQLSGGEMQRVALARALAGRPRLILADEPTGNLDSANAERVMDVLLRIAGEQRATLIVVTHSNELAAAMPKAVALRDGRIESQR